MRNVVTSSTNKHRGRPQEHRLAECLATLNALSQVGSITNARDLAQLLDIDYKRAAELLEQLCGEHNDTSLPLLPLLNTENKDEYTNVGISSSSKVYPLRLTQEETASCIQALDFLKVPANSQLRKELEEAFFARGTQSAANAKDEAASGGTDDANAYSTLRVFATSMANATFSYEEAPCITAPIVTFKYRGANDDILRTRRVVPLTLHKDDDIWIIEAIDCDAKAERSFRATLVEDCALTKELFTIPAGSQDKPGGGSVELTCTGDAIRRVLAWEGTHLVEQDADRAIIDVPYYRGDWLARHILALGSLVSYHNDNLEKEVRRAARANLRAAKNLKL